jgi:dienelactone hydrolase
VLVVHEWWGHNEHARNQARRLAEAGYVGFALDMYGDNKVTNHPDSAQAFMTAAVKDPATMAARFEAALTQLKQDPNVDSTRIAAIGYCFGGAVVLGMARAGMDLDLVGSFHGAIPPSAKVDSGKVKARVLIQTGGADPMVPATEVERFKKEMEAAGAKVEVISYPNAKHSFTNPDAGTHGMAGLAYDPEVDRQSWEALLRSLREAFQ